MNPISYSSWPRTDEGLIYFESKDEALFYAAQIYTNDLRIEEIFKNFSHVNNRILSNMPFTSDNLDIMKEIQIELQYYNDCLKEVMRLIKNQEPGWILKKCPTI